MFTISLWMYRNCTDSCVVILYLLTLSNNSLAWRFFPCDTIRIFSTIMLFWTNTFSPPSTPSFQLHVEWMWSTWASLSSSSQKRSRSLLPLTTIWLWDFYIWLLLYWRCFSSIPFEYICPWRTVEFCQIIFYNKWDDHVLFFPHSFCWCGIHHMDFMSFVEPFQE